MKRTIYFFFFSASTVALSFGQIDQTYPELCARPDGVVPLPPGISADVDRSTGHADLFVGSGSSVVKISIPFVVDEVEEVCPLQDGRFVLFGATYNTTNVNIVNPAKASLLDSFDGFNPAMSPNQRWLAYRKFYPRHTEEPTSEEYLLYDLSKSPAQNRPDGDTEDRWDVGSVIFPVGQKNSSGDHIGLPENQQHHPGSNFFFWSANSQAVVFGDILQGHFSVVLVTIDSAGVTKTYVHPLSIPTECAGKTNLEGNWGLFIERADVGPDNNGDRLIHLALRPTPGICEPKGIELNSADFQPAKAEDHPPRQYKRQSVEGH